MASSGVGDHTEEKGTMDMGELLQSATFPTSLDVLGGHPCIPPLHHWLGALTADICLSRFWGQSPRSGASRLGVWGEPSS